mmetsp:Transcript_2589/g.7155  ORF Transcript_2589/g.7155 Transcript_2589/m.7155 type:complete len:272 (-) Transcript_2589:324-1139(-)
MKHVCDGCVWIHPKVDSSNPEQYSQISSSFVVVHVSLEPVWEGTSRRSVRSSPSWTLPTRMAHVSMLRAVFALARFENALIRPCGISRGRSAADDARADVGTPGVPPLLRANAAEVAARGFHANGGGRHAHVPVGATEPGTPGEATDAPELTAAGRDSEEAAEAGVEAAEAGVVEQPADAAVRVGIARLNVVEVATRGTAAYAATGREAADGCSPGIATTAAPTTGRILRDASPPLATGMRAAGVAGTGAGTGAEVGAGAGAGAGIVLGTE